jgi:hypothetical protein
MRSDAEETAEAQNPSKGHVSWSLVIASTARHAG